MPIYMTDWSEGSYHLYVKKIDQKYSYQVSNNILIEKPQKNLFLKENK